MRLQGVTLGTPKRWQGALSLKNVMMPPCCPAPTAAVLGTTPLGSASQAGGFFFLLPLQICHLPSVGILWLMLGMTKPLVLEMHFPLARAPPNEVLPPHGTKAHIRRPASGRRRCCGNAWKRRPALVARRCLFVLASVQERSPCRWRPHSSLERELVLCGENLSFPPPSCPFLSGLAQN